ncbi:MAG TPA: peroxiredoxin family protein [Dermatophilaceae bacterium]|nr:peroxiredoxin family protein [Dermatophilaceae bacterium]
MSTKAARESREARRLATAHQAAHQAAHPGRSRAIAVVAAVLAVAAAIVAAMLATSRPQSTATSRTAPGFSLTNTAGAPVSLDTYRGRNVLLYFSEGAGCQACLVQMAEIEKAASQFAALDVTVLPIVMNTREQIMRDMAMNGVRTPFLLDDGAVSRAYGTLGKGMHGDLPGHSFVLIDRAGRQRWYGEYPSMWLAPSDLLAEVQKRLSS